MSVPHRHGAPAEVGDLLGDVVQPLHRPRRQHQVGARLGTSAGQGGAQRGTRHR